MSVEELRLVFDRLSTEFGIRNINCGNLRRIGKTECLKSMIRESRSECVVLVQYQYDLETYERDGYRAILVRDGNFRLRGHVWNVYADEVPDAEQRIYQPAQFIAGFYSTAIVGIGHTGFDTSERIQYALQQMQQSPISSPVSMPTFASKRKKAFAIKEKEEVKEIKSINKFQWIINA